MEVPEESRIEDVVVSGRLSTVERRSLAFLFLYLFSLISVAMLGDNWISFKTLYWIWFLAYVTLMFSILRSGILKRLENMDPKWVMISIFLITIILHIPFLLRDPSLSQDILRLERRGALLLDGKFPYRDFVVNKPPLYIWMVGLISLPIGPREIAFRIAFTFFSSLIPIGLYLIHLRWDGGSARSALGPLGWSIPGFDWRSTSIAVSLCPILLLETGLGGHDDPMVVLAVVFAFYFLLKKRPISSGLLLGTGFALKLYPIFLAPVFFLSLERWKDRILFTSAFLAVFFLASLPVLVVDPALMVEYFSYQFGTWYTGFSIRYGLEFILGTLSLPTRIGYYILTFILGGGLMYFLLRGMVGRFRRSDALVPFTLVFVLTIMGFILSSVLLYHGAGNGWDVAAAVVGTSFSLLFMILAFYVYLHWIPFRRSHFKGLALSTFISGYIRIEDVAFVISAVLLLVMFTSAQFHPWYLAWVIPFSLSSGIPYWSWSTLLLFGSIQANSYQPWELGGL